jgi:hypothetical protein
VNGSPFPSGAIQELVMFPSEWEVWKNFFQNVISSQVWKNVLQVFNLKVCGREFYELLGVSMLKFEVCGREFFNLLKSSNFKCQKMLFAIVGSFK